MSQAQRTAEMRFSASPERLKEIRGMVGSMLSGVGCEEQIVQDVVLAVDEACQNIIRHAYRGADGDILVQLSAEPEQVEVRLIDFAPPVDKGCLCPRALDDLRPGGLGTHFIFSVMDEVSFQPPPEGAGNLLRMVKHRGTPQ